MWELDCEEGWASKNCCFWTVVLEKSLDSSLDCKEIQPVHSEWDQPWDFFGRTDAKAETSVLWPPHAKSWLSGKDSDAGREWGLEEKGTTEDEMNGWHHWLDARESEWTLEVGVGQGDLACWDSLGCKESDTTEWLNWTEASLSITDSWSSLQLMSIKSVNHPAISAFVVPLSSCAQSLPASASFLTSQLFASLYSKWLSHSWNNIYHNCYCFA